MNPVKNLRQFGRDAVDCSTATTIVFLAVALWLGSVSTIAASLKHSSNCDDLRFVTSFIELESRPFAVAVGDFNGDGKADLATANYFTDSRSDNIAVLFGNGNGGFDQFASYQFGALPSAIATGDFNGDGKLDLVVCHSGSNAVTVLFNDGAGSFPRGSAFIINNPKGVVVGDFNGDGAPDLAVTEFGSVYLWVIPVSSDGSFQAAERYVVGQDPIAVAAGDFNRDGKLDLATANFSSNTISVLQNRGDGKFEAAMSYSVGGAPESITVGDFNTDGKADLAVASANINAVSVLLNNGDGSLKSPISYAVGKVPLAVATGDFDQDGKTDLAVANLGDNQVSVLLNERGRGFRAATNFSVGNRPAALAVGDFNADGQADVAVANSGATNVSVLLNQTLCKPVIPTRTRVKTFPNPSKAGHLVSFHISVCAVSGDRFPTGQVQLLEKGVPLSSWITLTDGKARFSTNHFKAGIHRVTVRYSGDATHLPSSRIVVQLVLKQGWH
ncbi:MAG: VCBS repeat-containing protein [Blastocatellia bacterium]|nr:VCBS repeat-containing protein [Blastocatellia bacterium]